MTYEERIRAQAEYRVSRNRLLAGLMLVLNLVGMGVVLYFSFTQKERRAERARVEINRQADWSVKWDGHKWVGK